MRKLLTATTALALVGGVAFAESSIGISGDAKSGIDFTSDPEAGKSKHSFTHEMGVDFTASGTTDGGLTFGGSAGFDTGDTTVNVGTVYVSGAFGKLTTGDNDSADLLAGGIGDIGLNGIDLDDVVEDLRGTTASQLRYDNSFGAISIALSAGTTDGKDAIDASPGLWTLTGSDGTVERQIVSLSPLAVLDNVLQFNNFVNYLPDAPEAPAGGGAAPVDPFEKYRAAAGFAITRTAATDDDDEMIAVSLASGGTNPLNIAGLSQKGEKVFAADGETEITGAQKAAFDAYAEAYDLGPDGKVGGGDDTPKAHYLALLDQVTAPVAGADAVPSDSQYAFGMSFEASGVTVGVGYDSLKTVSMGLGFSTGDISTNLLYVKTDDDTTGMGGDLSYTMGASTLTLAYAQRKSDADGTTDAMGINVSHDLGGGAELVAGFGDVEDVSRASVGLSFAF